MPSCGESSPSLRTYRGERATWSSRCLLLPCVLAELPSGFQPSPLEEKAALSQKEGPPGTKRPGNRLETWKYSWKRSQLPGYQAVWPDKMCMWHRQKAIITQGLAFFHMQPFCWQQGLSGGRERAYFSVKLTQTFLNCTKSRHGSFLSM